MTEPWFDPNMYAWIPGTFYGVTLGMMGGLTGYLASAGKAKTLCLTAWALAALTAAGFLITGLTAYLSGQPYGIWYGFSLPGILGLILIPTLTPQFLQRYREAENRKIQAADLDGV